MPSVRVGINGFGRIGRGVVRAAIKHRADIGFVAVNDIVEPATLAHLLAYDSVYGPLDDVNLTARTSSSVPWPSRFERSRSETRRRCSGRSSRPTS